jgi:hypothetical protein
MISKISAILAAALVLGSAGAAFAQTHRHAGWQAPYANSYNQDTRNLRYGHANDPQFDPLATVLLRTKILLEPHWFVSPCDSKNGSDAQRVAAISLICEGITSNYEDSRTTP